MAPHLREKRSWQTLVRNPNERRRVQDERHHHAISETNVRKNMIELFRQHGNLSVEKFPRHTRPNSGIPVHGQMQAEFHLPAAIYRERNQIRLVPRKNSLSHAVFKTFCLLLYHADGAILFFVGSVAIGPEK